MSTEDKPTAEEMANQNQTISVQFYVPNQVWVIRRPGNTNQAQTIYLYPNGYAVQGTDYDNRKSGAGYPVEFDI
jgi:hypothetical protein